MKEWKDEEATGDIATEAATVRHNALVRKSS